MSQEQTLYFIVFPLSFCFHFTLFFIILYIFYFIKNVKTVWKISRIWENITVYFALSWWTNQNIMLLLFFYRFYYFIWHIWNSQTLLSALVFAGMLFMMVWISGKDGVINRAPRREYQVELDPLMVLSPTESN